MTDIERIGCDVVVTGAGGSGLRAAIEARLAGKKTAIISKSLFGKAHTVMAEGGAAAAMGSVNRDDNWQVDFGDTMRGGKFLNNPRMAELHAKEAPERVWELEANSTSSSSFPADGHAIIARRGKEARNIAKVAAARELLTLIFYGLRDGQIRCLSKPADSQGAQQVAFLTLREPAVVFLGRARVRRPDCQSGRLG